MIKKIKIYITLAAVAFSSVSCLDKYPEDAIPEGDAIRTVEEANQAVIGIYAYMKNPNLYSGLLTLLPDLQADLAYAVEGYTNTYGNIWRWDILPTNTEVEAVYGTLNALIGKCNFLLERIAILEQEVDDEDYEKLQQFKGEALFARALAYSDLIKMYCKAYDPATAANELGVVLVSSYSNTGTLKRASLKDSYQFVLDDLAQSATCLEPDENENDESYYDTPYFTIYAVNALYARVYLNMQEWDKAIEYASKVIDSRKFKLSSTTEMIDSETSYYQYMWQYDHSTETIWKVGFTTTSYGGSLGQIFFNYDFNSFKPDYVPAEWVLNLYADTDLRATTFFQSYRTGYEHGLQWPLLAKYFGNQEFYEQNILHVTMPKVFRLSEQYLIRAEAYCQKSNPEYGKGASDLTTLRQARYSNYGSASLTEEDWFKEISEERVRELYMEGFRLNDLKRWGQQGLVDGFTRKPQANTIAVGSSLKVDASNPLFVWPIPQHELDLPGSQVEPNESNK